MSDDGIARKADHYDTFAESYARENSISPGTWPAGTSLTPAAGPDRWLRPYGTGARR